MQSKEKDTIHRMKLQRLANGTIYFTHTRWLTKTERLKKGDPPSPHPQHPLRSELKP